MRPETSLRRRLVTAHVLLAVVIGGVFASATFVIVEMMERELLEVRLSRVGEVLVEAYRAGMSRPPSLDFVFAADGDIPEDMRGLPPGLSEIESRNRILHVLIVHREGHQFAVIDDVTEFERIEFLSFLAVCTAFFAGVLLALALARASVNRIVAPLTELTAAVQTDKLTAHADLLTAPDEIGMLARAFRDSSARERLFTADMSHELRTPLTVILGAAELLTDRLAGTPQLREIAERIYRTSQLTSRRVSALLQLARHPGQIERVPVAMRALVEQEIDRCRPLLDGKPVALTFDSTEETIVRAAPDLAAIAIGNLLQNACNFTEAGSVRVTLDRKSLVIEDTGPGIPHAVRERLFEPFVRGADESSTGWGLGLSIVKRVANYLGWLVRIDDAGKGGSRVTITFDSLERI